MLRCGRRLLAIMLLVGALVAPPARAATSLRPGGRLTAPSTCTIGFVFTDGDRLYVATAGHCTTRIGERAAAADIGAFGTVVYRREVGSDDVAFVIIDRALEARVEPVVAGFRAPTGVASWADTQAGDRVGISGYGTGFEVSPLTRARTGALAGDDARTYTAVVPAVFGDSGGPVLHLPTGAALGIVGGLRPAVPPGTLVGTTVARALELAGDAGLSLSLVTG